MKKFLSLILALVLVLSMATVAFADETYPDVDSITLTKVYKLENTDVDVVLPVSPAEDFEFSALTCIDVTNGGVLTDENGDVITDEDGNAKIVDKTSAPVPTISTTDSKASFAQGAASVEGATDTITIDLPEYKAVGIYTYEFEENVGDTAGVTYNTDKIYLVVTVIEQDEKIRVAAVHTEGSYNAGTYGTAPKSDKFENKYFAGTLAVSKAVTGILGDLNKEFTVTVTFTAPEGKVIGAPIAYTEDGTNKEAIISSDKKTATAEIQLKHDETIKFTNIPDGVTYTVVETVPSDYEAAQYTFSDGEVTTGKIDKDNTYNDTVHILNTKGGTVDTGISMDTIPYIVLLAVAFVGMIALVAKKRAREF